MERLKVIRGRSIVSLLEDHASFNLGVRDACQMRTNICGVHLLDYVVRIT